MREQASSLRILVGCVTGLAIMVLAVILISPLGLMLSSFIDRIIPAVSNVTQNTNTEFWGNMLLLPLAFAFAVLSTAIIIDPGMARRAENTITVVIFGILISVSGINFWSNDTLINVNAQAAIDIVLAVFSLALIGMMLRWNPTLMITSSIQKVGLFMITVFGFVMPMFYATKLIALRFGYSSAGLGIQDIPG